MGRDEIRSLCSFAVFARAARACHGTRTRLERGPISIRLPCESLSLATNRKSLRAGSISRQENRCFYASDSFTDSTRTARYGTPAIRFAVRLREGNCMKKNIHPLKQKRREDRRLEKLGSDNPFCLYCGFSMPMILRPVTREFLERHHLLGIATDRDLTLALCFNCHALAEEDLLVAGVNKSKKRESNPVRLARNICTR